MKIEKLLSSPLMTLLILPCFTTLTSLIKPLLKILHNNQTTSLNHYLTVFDQDTNIKVSNTEQINCVFCLSDIIQGEEIHKLSCTHLFHRFCLDKWLKYQRPSCPLCRSSLAFLLKKEKVEFDETDDEEPEDSDPPLLAFLQSEWWGRCIPSLE